MKADLSPLDIRKKYIPYNRGDMATPSNFFGVMTVKENRFQSGLIKELKERFPGCMVLKNDPNYIQGMPDLTVLYENKWAMLECKKSKNEPHQPNQDHYVEQGNKMSFARFIFPENKTEVLDELQQAFES